MHAVGQMLFNGGNLSVAQRARSRRLLAILRNAFGSHPKTLTLINAFSEGINLSNADVAVNPELQASNGFELVRQLTLEYNIRTRSEALSFRTALAGKSFTLHGNETSASTVVTDTIRKIDFEMARDSKLLELCQARLMQRDCMSLKPIWSLFCEEAAHYDMSASDGNGNWNLDAVGAVRIDGELVLKRFVARNVKAITPVAWNQTIGDQLFLELEGGGNQGQVQVPAQPMAVPAGVHVEPAAPDVNRPRLPAADTARPMEDDVVEYPDGAPGDLVREMKESDPTYRAPLPRKQAAEPAPPPRKPGTPVPMTLDLFVADNACDTLGPVEWFLEQGPEKARVTSPEVFDGELNSIKFAPEKSHTCVKVKLGLHFVLTLAAQRALRLKGLDVSHAFMHSPLPKGFVIVLKLPQSVSLPDGSQAYLLL
eukprot:s4770_g7.t1